MNVTLLALKLLTSVVPESDISTIVDSTITESSIVESIVEASFESSKEEETSTTLPKVDEDALNEVNEELGFDLGEMLSQYFSPAVVASILSIITTLAVVLKTLASLKTLATKSGMTTTEVCTKVTDSLNGIIKTTLDKTTLEAIEPMMKQVNELKNMNADLTKALVLMQEGSAESKLAILELLQKSGKVEQETIDNVKKEIEDEQKEIKENEEKTSKELDEIVENTKPTNEGRI